MEFFIDPQGRQLSEPIHVIDLTDVEVVPLSLGAEQSDASHQHSNETPNGCGSGAESQPKIEDDQPIVADGHSFGLPRSTKGQVQAPRSKQMNAAAGDVGEKTVAAASSKVIRLPGL